MFCLCAPKPERARQGFESGARRLCAAAAAGDRAASSAGESAPVAAHWRRAFVDRLRLCPRPIVGARDSSRDLDRLGELVRLDVTRASKVTVLSDIAGTSLEQGRRPRPLRVFARPLRQYADQHPAQLVRFPTQPSHDKGDTPNGRHMVPLRTSHVSASIFLGNEVAQPSAKGTSKTTSPLS
jgi:hypothetical protein